MEKTENLGLTIIPEQTHITFPLLNILMDIINTNFIILDTLSNNSDSINSQNCPSIRINRELIEAMKLLQSDISTIDAELTKMKDDIKKSDSVLDGYSKNLMDIQNTIDAIPDTYIKKDEIYDNVSIDKIAESVKQLKVNINKIIRNINEILLYVSNHMNSNSYYTRSEVDEKIEKINLVNEKIEELSGRCVDIESNQKLIQIKLDYVIGELNKRSGKQ